MNWLDILLCLILLLSTIAAARRGFSREIIGIAAAIAGLVFGIWFYGLAGAWLLPYVSSPRIANFIGFFIVFLGFVILGALAGTIVRRLVKTVGLSWFDRLLGAGFGIIRGLLLCVAMITALVAFAPVAPDTVPASVAGSRLAPYVVQTASYLVMIAPKDLKDSFQTHYQQLKSFWGKGAEREI